ncbi:MAG: type II CAAX endopeptidase family protein [Propionibacteriaceae bacterium]|nr:type II CAAX endopeptidase family protein [Propionibacteriaceae bacterium]
MPESLGSAANRANSGPGATTGWPIAAFYVLACALAWLVALPVWLTPDPAPVLVQASAVIMMFTPSVAAIIVVRLLERRPVIASVGLKSQPWRRTLASAGVVWAVLLVIVAFAMGASVVLGTLQVSGFSVPMLGAISAAVLINPVVSLIPTLGEEVGWRGYLYPRLQARLGVAGAVVLTGVMWALWHAPLILRGYNYPAAPLLGLGLFIVPCIGMSAVLAWGVERGGSVWPAAIGHGVFNAATSVTVLLLQQQGTAIDTVAATPLGWASWPVWLLTVVVMMALMTWPARPQQ